MLGRLFTLGTVFIILSSPAGVSEAQDLSRTIPSLPASIGMSVNRVLPSKPGDFFVVLKNGMTVLLRENPSSEVVSAQIYVRAGSLYEGKYQGAGLSHYLEHVVSGGTTRSFSEAQAKERLQSIGGSTNASTSYDRTIYYINTSAEKWKDALDLLLSYVSENVLDSREVTREKAVIQQEIKMGENSPERELWKLFTKTAYRIHPVRYPIIGYEEVFVEQDRDALMDYYAQRYQPQNMVAVVVGNISAPEVLQFVAAKTESFVRRSGAPPVLPEEPAVVSPRWEEKEMPIARLTQAIVAFPSVRLDEKDLYALDVLALLMGDGETSRLQQRLKDQEKKVLGVSASNWTPPYVKGCFMISLDLPPQNWPGVMTSIEEEIERFKRELVSGEDLEKAKKSAIAQRIFSRETVSAQASSLGSSYFDTGDPYFDEVYVAGIRGVTPEEVLDVARRYLVLDRVTVAALQPRGTREKGGPAETSAEVISKKLIPERHQLKNGLRFFVKEDSSLPMVTIKLYGLGGLLLEDRQKPGLSAFTASLLTAGTKTRSKLDIARAIENVGGMIDSRSDNTTYHVSVKVLKEDLDLALEILGDVVQNAQFPEDEIEKTRQETLLAIKRIDENWEAEVVRLFKKNYFEKSPYGNERTGTAESVQGFTRKEIVAFYERMVNPYHSVLAVYGDVNPEHVKAMIRKNLENWKGKPSAPPDPPLEVHPLKSDRSVEKKNEKTSSALLIGTNGVSIDSSDRPVLDVMDAILSGAANPAAGRLFQALRGGAEDLVYVVGAFPFYGVKAGFFGVITQTTLANLDKVQGIILENFRRLCEEPVSPEEIEKAKNMVITSHRMGLESQDAQAMSTVVNEVLGLGWEYDRKYIQLIQGVKVEDVQRVARRLLPNTLIVRTVPEKPVEILTPLPSKNDIQVR